MRLFVAVALVAGSLLVASGVPPAAAQQLTPCADETGNYSNVSRPGSLQPLAPEIVHLPSELDGVDIEVGIGRPDVPEGTRVPVIVDASPYFHALGSMDWTQCPRIKRLIENYLPHGYAVAAIPVRGTGDSGGCMNLFGAGEQADLDQAVTWLGTQPWSSGSVAMMGKSYDGSTPWEVASFGNPHLKTIVVSEGVPSVFDLLFGGGTPDWRGPGVLSDIYFAESGAFYLPGRDAVHTAEVSACPEYVTGNLAALYSWATGELDPFGYWAERDFKERVAENYRGSVFMLQGLQDWNVNPGQQFPWINGLEAGGLYVKYLVGQWGHNWPDDGPSNTRRADFGDMLLAWFDYWLKDVRCPAGDAACTSETILGPRSIVQDADRDWHESDESWPPSGGALTWHLTADGGLAPEASEATGSVTLAADPDHVTLPNDASALPGSTAGRCAQPNCAAFSTAPLAEPLHVAGLPQLRVDVTPTGPAGQLSAYLYSVEEGTYQRVGWGQVDLRFPAGGRERHEVAAGQPVAVDVSLQPLDKVVPAGANLVLVLSEGSAYNRLPSIPNAPVTLAVGGPTPTLSVTTSSLVTP